MPGEHAASGVSAGGDPAVVWPVFDDLRSAQGLLLAVSGGPDSTALMHLAAGWAVARGAPLPAVASVDHGLRAESQAESQAVVEAARALGLRADMLVWTGDKPSHSIAERARAARYRLLADHARRIGASHLLTAHTLDDQAETVVMRLARGTGLAGAAAMRRETDLGGVTLVRPLLQTPKTELVALCHANGWAYVEDPSNSSQTSARVRWRCLAPALAAEGLTAARLARFAARAARADDALRRLAELAAREADLTQEPGIHRLRFASLSQHGEEIVLRVLFGVLAPSRDPSGLRLERLEALGAGLRAAFDEGRPLRRTLAGQVVSLDRSGVLSFAPETGRRRGLSPALPAPTERGQDLQPATLTARSLGNETPVSYIAHCDATARCADAVETRCASFIDGQVVLLSPGPQ